jgi:molybdopterin/thiamine biosynthesis adenylyltransferase/nitroreductase
MIPHRFDFEEAFSRNIGWVTREEQALLRTMRAAIAGLGGVGGGHLLTLTRLGIGAFHIADFDAFELANFNRQAGAGLSSLGHKKIDVLADLAKQINPTLDLRLFPDGVNGRNLDTFLEGVDVFVDGLDFFAVSARRAVFAACARLGIPAVTAAPLGMGAALLSFLPGRMTFEDYFRLEGQPEQEQLLRFLVGLSPAMLQTRYLVDPSVVDLLAHRGPSTPMACDLCVGMAGAQVLKILLKRGDVIAAPRGLQMDAYRNRLVRTFRPGGNRHPLQQLALAVARRRFAGASAPGRMAAPSLSLRTEVEEILDLARWAPSGDNTQPWLFETDGSDRVVVHGRETGKDGVYDLDSRSRQLALGACLETLAIAATSFRRRACVTRRPAEGILPVFDVDLTPDERVAADPLASAIPERSVQRRALKTRRLTAAERGALEAAVAPGYTVCWLEGRGRLGAALLNFHTAGLRLNLPEAYPVHRQVVQWGARTSLDRIPDGALGLDPLTRKLMRWVMKSWARVRVAGTLGGTLVPRLEMDLLPGLACAAHFALVARRRAASTDDFVAAGRALQRFWLTATALGLQLQPEMAPLIFRRYDAYGIAFTRETWARRAAAGIRLRFDALLGQDRGERAVFFGRIGQGKAARARSLRLPLEQLCRAAADPFAREEPVPAQAIAASSTPRRR